MSQDKFPSNDYREDLEKAIREARSAIKEAIGYIERQEDGPLTMRFALREIEDRVAEIETEMGIMTHAIEDWRVFAMRLRRQRDDALRERDNVLRSMKNNPNV